MASLTDSSTKRVFGSDADVARITGISRKTLQHDRNRNVQRFPWYRAGRRILYDLAEIEAIIRSSAKGKQEAA